MGWTQAPDDNEPAGDIQDPAEQYKVGTDVTTEPSEVVKEEAEDSTPDSVDEEEEPTEENTRPDNDPAVDTVDEKVVETDDVKVTETHAESPANTDS